MTTTEHKQVVETAKFGPELKHVFFKNFPQIAEKDQPVLDAYRHSRFAYASFSIDSSPLWTGKIVEAIVERALSPNDQTYVASTLTEKFRMALLFIQEDAKLQRLEREVQVDKQMIGQEARGVRRLVLKGVGRQDVPRVCPGPQVFAMELNASSQPKNDRAIKRILKEMISRHGASFGIMACIFFGWDENKIINLFSDTAFRKAVTDFGEKRLRLPHRSNYVGAEKALGEAIKNLGVNPKNRLWTVIKPLAYRNALTILETDWM